MHEPGNKQSALERAGVAAAVLVTALLAVLPAVAAAAQESEEAAAIRGRVDAYLTAWNAHDASGVAAMFTEDADMVMGNAAAAHGRQEIRDNWQQYFGRQEPERRLILDVGPVRLVAPGVAVITVATTTGGRDAGGGELNARKFRGTWLWRRQGDEWLIAAMRGLPIEEDRVVLNASAASAERLKPDVRGFVAAYEEALNSHDPSAVTAFYRDDAEIIIRNLPATQGRRAIEDWWRAYFSEPRPYRALLIIDEMRTIAPDVILLNITATGDVGGSAQERPPVRTARATWILRRQSGEWGIAALWLLPSEDDEIIRAPRSQSPDLPDEQDLRGHRFGAARNNRGK